MYKGECLCGAVKFKITGKIEDIVCCHCSECRKVQGSAFATNGNVESKHFHFLTGKDKLKEYQSSTYKSRFFCIECGSPVIAKFSKQPDKTRIRLGLIIGDIAEKISGHIFVASKANWETIPNDAPHYKEWKT